MSINVIAQLDRMVHDPSRLAILSALLGCEEMDFTFLMSVTGLTKGNLSSHISKLEEAGLIEVKKTAPSRRTLTFLALTAQGREKLLKHWQALEQLHSELFSAKTR